ncbi:MAG: 4Fe-4S binding protein [Defluviitaleaceae bacterium]|nr:4Fe-4S binding protein [Defluviitaleaceae bacterium]
MAYKITDACINCGVCVDECPVTCISEGGSTHVIDEPKCIDCSACANVCPVDACEPV